MDSTLKSLSLGWEHCLNVAEKSYPPVLAQNLTAHNQSEAWIPQTIPIKTPDVLLSKEKFNRCFEERRSGISTDETVCWDKFYQEYPGSPGLISFSRVGFDETRKKSLVFWLSSSGSESTSGNLVFLIKDKGHWVIKDEKNCFQT